MRARAAATFAASLKLENVTRTYGEAAALTGINLEIAPGEIICLLGPSGCGKTTLLRVISGIERPTSGRVLINDSEVAGPNRFVPPENRSVGLMFQDFALFPHLSVIENVAFGLKSLPSVERTKAARAILERVGLTAFANAYPSTLSGGQQQRVALARAIVPRPAVMLMDEPFSGLDVQLRDTMQEETLALLRETRATSLIVTHHPEEAMRLSDRIAVLRDGRVVQVGTTQNLYEAPASLFVARLFSEINEMPARVSGGQISTAAGVFPAPDLPDGSSAVLCIRERAITLEAAKNGNGTAPGALLGRVQDLKFLGDITRLDVAVQGFDHLLKVRSPGINPFPKGSEVVVKIEREAVLVFQADANGDNGENNRLS
ncbi:MAG: iron ABC transporter ATP-binding protein [Hyphomicrobium sp.]|nr:MAG: iron ABC transporter ATP-binding protein [Hyphomicrobium sp.]PPC98535.1 MAG: iron ABC transporter ATP-binding protein [Hyphomicrobium sp.]